jgi:hypothetical protein
MISLIYRAFVFSAKIFEFIYWDVIGNEDFSSGNFAIIWLFDTILFL